MGLGGGGGAQTATTTTTQELAPEQQQLLKSVIPVAEQFVQNPPQLFPGSQIAPQNPLQQQAQQQFLQAAGGPVAQGAQEAANTQSFLLGPELFNPDTNPALAQATQAAIRPIEQQFTQSILPNVRGGANTSGQFGGSRQGIAEGIASQSFLQQVGDTSAQFQNRAFSDLLDAQGRGLLLAPQTQQLQFGEATATEAVGRQQQQLAQNKLTEEADRFFAEQTLPFAAAQDVAQLAFGIGGGSTTSVATRAGGSSNSIGSALGGAASGAALGNMLLPGGWGAAAGGVLGGLAGLFG